jgi:hypothetical protein
MNRIPFSLPSGTTWRLLGSVVLNPTKQPCCKVVVVLSLLDFELRKVVVVMLGGTWVRKGWPFARKHDLSKVIDKGGGLVMSTRPIMFRGSVAVLVMLGGAMVIDETQLAY